MLRVARPAIAVALLTATVLLGAPSTAFAHASLQSSTPAPNSVLEASPPEIILDFDDAVEVGVASIELFNGNGDSIEVGMPRHGDDASTLTASVPALDEGLYAVIWRVTSADGHPIDGSFSFQIGTTATGNGDELIAQVRGGARSPESVRWAYGIARFLSLLGAIAAIGASGWLLTGASAAGERALARLFCRGAAAVFVLGTVAAFVLFGAHATAGTFGDAFDPGVWRDVASTDTGRALLLRAVFASALLALTVLWDRRQLGWWRGAAVAASAFAIATFPLSGHANSSSPRLLWFAVDFAHLAAITVWLGGLFVLLIAGREVLAAARNERLARRFSTAATVCIPLIVGTGVLQVWKLAGNFSDVAATDWGRVLLVKVTLVVVLLAFAAVSRWLLLHDGSTLIRRTVVVEALVGVVVLGLAAGMGALPPAPVVAAHPFAAQLASNGLIVEVSVGPGVVGSNELHLVITPPGGSIVPVITVIARVLLEAEAIPPSLVELLRESGNHYSGDVTFPRAGEWTLEVIVQVTEDETVLLKATVPVG